MRGPTTSRHLAFAAIALVSTSLGSLLLPQQARADDCLLDTNNDGDADLTDTDRGANSGGAANRLACGMGALASGALSMGDRRRRC